MGNLVSIDGVPGEKAAPIFNTMALAADFEDELAQDPKSIRDALLTIGLDIACNHDTSSPTDKAVFFSGAEEKRQAVEFCRKNPGHKNVCMTEALNSFDNLKLFKRMPLLTIKEIYDLGDIISERFAQEASGNIRVFTSDKCKPHGTFMRMELPAIMANEKITAINNMSKDDFYRDFEKHVINGPQNSFRVKREIGASLKVAV